MNKTMNKEVIFCIGVPASGKSTWSKDFAKNNTNYVRVCRDDYRYMFKDVGWFEDEVRNKLETIITNFIYNDIISLLNAGFNVIIDETNVNKKRLVHIIKRLKNDVSDLNIKFEKFAPSYDVIIDRDKNRERSVGEDVIRKMCKNYNLLMDEFDLVIEEANK